MQEIIPHSGGGVDLSKSLIENSVGGCSSGFVSIFVLNLVVLCSYKIFGVCEDFLLSYLVDKSIFLVETLIYLAEHPPGYPLPSQAEPNPQNKKAPCTAGRFLHTYINR